MKSRRLTIKHFLLHAARIAMLASVLGLIRLQHLRWSATIIPASAYLPAVAEKLDSHFPGIQDLEGEFKITVDQHGEYLLRDVEGNQVGTAIQTSPNSDHIIGFSGPTNALLAFDDNDLVVAFAVLSSGDTRDHLRQVTSDEAFVTAFHGKSRDELRSMDVDAVSGATLTSLAIVESIRYRLGGIAAARSLRFPEPLSTENARQLFPDAASVSATSTARWQVQDASSKPVGSILRTTPDADNVVGYQGPTETLVGVDQDGKVNGVAIGKSYDNEPYVGYIRDDKYFKALFDGQTLEELANLDWEANNIEGVSGATMTSMAVTEGMVLAAQRLRDSPQNPAKRKVQHAMVSFHDVGTICVVLAGTIIGMTQLRSRRIVKTVFQLLLIGYLGLTAGNLVSQAMLVGWAKHDVPWRAAFGLVFLCAAAFALPIATKRNLYCTHLCPHGAVQQLLRNRLKKQQLPRRLKRFLSFLPAMLLAWCVLVGMTSLGYSLVDIEPFDAYIFRIAGWATITVAVIGLAASLFVPMAYCRYGCPTGAVLQWLRFNTGSDRWSIRDWTALALLSITAMLYWVGV